MACSLPGSVRRALRLAFLALCAGLVSGVSPAGAAVLYWDANADLDGTGGTGIWDTTAALFRTGAPAGPLASWTASSPNLDEAVFGGIAGTVTIAGGSTLSANRLAFVADNYTLGGASPGSRLSLTGSVPTISVGAGLRLNLNVAVAGASLRLDGGGAMKLGSSERLADSIALAIDGGSTLELGVAETVSSVLLRDGRLGAAMNEGGAITAALYSVESGEITATLHGSGGLMKTTAGTVTISGNANNDYSGATRVLGGTLMLAGSNALSRNAEVVVDGGTLQLAGFSQTAPRVSLLNGAITGGNTLRASDADAPVYVENGTISVYLQANGGLSKGGAGTVRLFNTADMNNHAITVSGGLLDLTGATVLNTGSVTVSGGVLSASGYQFQNARVSLEGGILSPGGDGAVNGMTARESEWSADSGFNFNLWDATGAPGIGYDFLSLSNGLKLKGLGNGKFDLAVIGLLSSTGGTGLVSNFDSATAYSWTFVTASQAITGFNSKKFTVDLSGFANAYNGLFSVDISDDGRSLSLVYTPTAIPEPQTYAALLGGATLLLAGVRSLRRRRG